MLTVDYLIVGSGLTGATIARSLHDSGREVVVIERRSHVGGNVHDGIHESGIPIHRYGPHYFRTGSANIWEYANRFGSFHPYQARIMSSVDGVLECWPIVKSYIDRTVGADWRPAFRGTSANFEEASLAMMPRSVYEKFVKGYTEKQWGVSARNLQAALAGRFDVRMDGDTRLSRHRYQGIPAAGYHCWMKSMLEGIPVELGRDFFESRDRYRVRKCLIYTGAIDAYFGFRYGRLKYRGQRRAHRYLAESDYFQPCAQVNTPGEATAIRTLEWKHLMPLAEAARVKGTVLTEETPFTATDENDFEYPFPDAANRELYRRYAGLAAAERKLLVCGRLGEYRYFDMDQAIGRAMIWADKLIGSKRPIPAFILSGLNPASHSDTGGRASRDAPES